MGRHRRQSGHLQGTFPPPKIEPSRRPAQVGLCFTQPQYNQPSRPVFSAPASQQAHRQPGQPRGYSFVVAEYPHTPSTTDALSPVTTRSTLSRPGVAASTSTSYTGALERARKFSPEADDTPSPSTGGPNYHPHRLADHASGQPLNSAVSASGYPVGADHAMTEAVAGIDTRVPFGDPSQYPLLYSPQNSSPVGQQRYPGQVEPWTAQFLRQEGLYLNMETSRPVPPGQDRRRLLPIRERGGGGRTGPLNPVQRQQTRDVRKRGACLRCTIMKEKCDCGSPCANCSTKERRKCPKDCIPSRYDWDGCKASLFPGKITAPLRMLPADQTDELTYRLRKENLCSYLATVSIPASSQPFLVPLDLYIGAPLSVLVIEFSPLDPDSEIGHAFQTSHDSDGQRSLHRQENWNPPIVMCIREAGMEATIGQVRQNLIEIFDMVLNDPKLYLTWTAEYFEDREEEFPSKILRLVGRYYRDDLAEHSVLKNSLRLLWCEYLLLNRFTIPADGVSILEQNLTSGRRFGAPRHQKIVPQMINRFLKSAIIAMAEKAAEGLLKNLHDMMFKMAVSQKAPQDRRDLVLCMLFVLVIFLGRIQIALFLFAHMPGIEEDMACSQEEVEEKIEEMEERVCGYLLPFHRYALGRASSRTLPTSAEHDSSSERHAREFDLENQLRHEIEDYVGDKPEILEPGEYHMNTFRYRNVLRLCWKVIENIE